MFLFKNLSIYDLKRTYCSKIYPIYASINNHYLFPIPLCFHKKYRESKKKYVRKKNYLPYIQKPIIY